MANPRAQKAAQTIRKSADRITTRIAEVRAKCDEWESRASAMRDKADEVESGVRRG